MLAAPIYSYTGYDAASKSTYSIVTSERTLYNLNNLIFMNQCTVLLSTPHLSPGKILIPKRTRRDVEV